MNHKKELFPHGVPLPLFEGLKANPAKIYRLALQGMMEVGNTRLHFFEGYRHYITVMLRCQEICCGLNPQKMMVLME